MTIFQTLYSEVMRLRAQRDLHTVTKSVSLASLSRSDQVADEFASNNNSKYE